MPTTEQSTDPNRADSHERVLSAINVRIGDAVRDRDADFLRSVLSPSFVVRRPDGVIVDREGYLALVFGRRYARIATKVDHIRVFEDAKATTAVVSVLVEIDMDEAGVAVTEGTFRNTRVFEWRDRRWSCLAWLNSFAS